MMTVILRQSLLRNSNFNNGSFSNVYKHVWLFLFKYLFSCIYNFPRQEYAIMTEIAVNMATVNIATETVSSQQKSIKQSYLIASN